MLTRHTRDDHVPTTDARLASLLDAAAAPAEPGPVTGEEAALAAFRASSSAHALSRRSRMHLPTTPLKSLGVAAASAGLVLTGGLGAAYAGVLPGAAQDAVQGMLASINVDVPGADEHSEGHADTGGRSEEAPPAGTTEPGTKPEQAEHGETVSGLATSTEGGRDKGELISETASDGKAGGHSQEHAPEQPTATGGADGTDAGAAARSNNGQGDHAKVETPNGGGTTTADGATADAGTTDGGGASGHGTGTAGDMSDGRSRDGSGNRP